MGLSIEKGFTLIEALISISILLLLAVGGISANRLATAAITLNRDRSQANSLADEGMEAVESVRAANFLSLSTGDFHPVNGPVGWSLMPGVETIGKFTRVINISQVLRDLSCSTTVCDIVSAGGIVDTGSLMANVTVSWPESDGTKNINLSALITYFR